MKKIKLQAFDIKRKKRFWKQLEIVIRVLKNGSESSEVTCCDSQCGQSFHMSSRYFSQRIPSFLFSVIQDITLCLVFYRSPCYEPVRFGLSD